MERHLSGLASSPGVLLYEKKLGEVRETDARQFKVKKAFSQVAEARFLVKNLETLVSVCIAYAPSAVEILSPKKVEIKIDEVQRIANLLAGLIHRFASMGIGGVVIKTNK